MADPAGARPSLRPYAYAGVAVSAAGAAWTLRQVRRDMVRADAEAAVVRTLDKREISAYVHERYRPYAKLALKHATGLSLCVGLAATCWYVAHYDIRHASEVREHMRGPMTAVKDAVRTRVVPWSQSAVEWMRAPLTRTRKGVDRAAKDGGVREWAAGRSAEAGGVVGGMRGTQAGSYDTGRVRQEEAVLDWLERQGGDMSRDRRRLAEVGRSVERRDADAGPPVPQGKGRFEAWSDGIRDWVLGGPQEPKA